MIDNFDDGMEFALDDAWEVLVQRGEEDLFNLVEVALERELENQFDTGPSMEEELQGLVRQVIARVEEGEELVLEESE